MKLRAGTRKSPLAMAQTYMVLDMIKAAFPECDIEMSKMQTVPNLHLRSSFPKTQRK